MATIDTAQTGPEIDVSLICGTLGRSHRLPRLMESLSRQENRGFELILVAQDNADAVLSLARTWSNRIRTRVFTTEKGLSRARNFGIVRASGKVLGFPDDDCWYPPTLVKRVVEWFDSHPEYGALSVAAKDALGTPIMGRVNEGAFDLDKLSLLLRCCVCSISIFMRRDVVRDAGMFAEDMGLGAPSPYQSSEDLDLPAKALRNGCRFRYDPTMTVFHDIVQVGDHAMLDYSKVCEYACGVGYFIRRHDYPLMVRTRFLIAPVARCAMALLVGRTTLARYYYSTAVGRTLGLFSRGAPRHVPR